MKGIQDQDAVDFFVQTIDNMLALYPHKRFASICDLTELILSPPKMAMQRSHKKD